MSSDESSNATDSLELPALPDSSHGLITSSQASRRSSKTSLRTSKAYVFTAGLFRHVEIDIDPPSMQCICTQPSCKYQTIMPLVRVTSIGNLLKYYHALHKGIPTSAKEAKALT